MRGEYPLECAEGRGLRREGWGGGWWYYLRQGQRVGDGLVVKGAFRSYLSNPSPLLPQGSKCTLYTERPDLQRHPLLCKYLPSLT